MKSIQVKDLKFSVLFAILVLLLASSCSNEEDIVPSFGSERAGSITFRIQGKQQPVSYAIATADENAVDSLEIYMFSDRSAEGIILQKVFRVGSDGMRQNATELMATVDVTDRSGKHIFYFVANGKDNASSLEDAELGVTTEEDFIEHLTDVQSGLLETPLLMTARKVIADVESPTDDEKKVKLLRRVARFDVTNDASDTNFTIDNILINNAKTQGYIFGNATGTPAQTLATNKLPIIKNNNPNDFNTGTPVASAFYLYPTTLDADQTVISFEGTFLGKRFIYNLQSNISIEANKRYILNVKKEKDDTPPEFTIEAEDWGDGSEHQFERETKDISLSEIKMAGGKDVIANDMDYDITNISEETTLTFTVKSFHALSTTPEIKGNKDDLPGFSVTASTPALTYAAHYSQDYTIVIPKRTNRAIPINIRIEIVNQANTKQRPAITIHGDEIPYYPGTTLWPVVFKGVTWAPVNVGATEIGGTKELKHTGYYYQWGRSTGFVFDGEKGKPSDVYSTEGPVTSDDVEGVANGLFIKSSVTPFDWLTPQDNSLWSGDNQQGPCPDGWRLPNNNEVQSIVTTYGTGYNKNGGVVIWNDTEKRIEIKGDNETDILYFHASGQRYNNTGGGSYHGAIGSYWTSETTTERSMVLTFNPSGVFTNDCYRASGNSVRCVKEK